ncbi:MAG: hypothetical protein QXM68_03610 [Candidatus Aenigmatarchaeota archaeon]|nr:hypothetical protein [Candidatus Aenigmarchaeota archaeon]
MKFLVFVIALFIINTAAASYISLTTYTNVDVIKDSKGTINITIENSGDESANNVRITLLSDQFIMDDEYAVSINPNSKNFFQPEIIAKTSMPGTYVSTLKVEYQDANGKVFSAINPVQIDYKQPSFSSILIEVDDVKIEEKSTSYARVKIKNFDNNERKFNLKLYLPQEMTYSPLVISDYIGSKAEKTLTFKLRNNDGIAGSEYAFFAVLEYQDQLHYSSFETAKISIQPKSFFNLPLILSILFLLLVLALAYMSKVKKK